MPSKPSIANDNFNPERAFDFGVEPIDEHNRRLVENVHPPDWTNPEPSGRYNLVVIGAGTAGLVAAAGAAGLGARVALVEKRLMGGDCLNFGCVPSKALLRAARAAADVRRAGELGVRLPDGFAVDFPAVMERMRRLRARISPHDSAARFRDLGVDVYLGEARFTGADTLDVSGQTLRFSKAVIATGARASVPPIPGLAEVGCLNNETVFTLSALPRRLAVIGAGPLGCEFSQAFARFGSEVTLLEARPRILAREDRDAAEIVERSMQRDGITIRCGIHIVRVHLEGREKVLELETNEQRGQLRVDAILVGVGRSPNIERLGLDQAGVSHDESGLVLDDRLRTTNGRIYAAGDVCGRDQFTHAADAMARIVLQNALFLGRAKASRLTIPRCTFTDPEVAHVGLDEQAAADHGIRIHSFVETLHNVDRAILDGETEGFVKIHVRERTDRILGATIVSRHAGDLISEISVAIEGRLGLKRLARTIHPYPTQAEAVKRVADAYNRTRLTPFVQGLFKRWLAWSR